MRGYWIGLLTALLFPLASWAQPLSDRVPEDAMLYIGWQGSQAMPPAYQASHLKGLLDSSNIPQFFEGFVPQVMDRIIRADPQTASVMQVLRSVGGPLWRHPSAFFFAGADFTSGDPRPKLGLLCQAGSEADALLGQLQHLATLASQDSELPIKAFKQGDLVGFVIGYEQEALAMAGKASSGQAKPLSGNLKFQVAQQQAGKNALAIVYLDGAAALSLVDGELRDTTDPEFYAAWTKARDALGLAGFREILFSAGFDGKEWCTQGFIGLPAPRNGLAAMFGDNPLSPETLKLIPQTSEWAGAGQVNLAGFLDGLRAFAVSLEPNAGAEFDRGLAQINQNLKIDLRQDLLGALGTEWAFYSERAGSGSGLAGLTLINRLVKPAEAERSLSALENVANLAMASMPERNKVQISFAQEKVGSLTVHTLSLPLVAPSWTIKDGVLYAGLYPQVVVASAEARKDKSILDNAAFQSLQKRMGTAKLSSFSFTDLPQTAADGYQTLLSMSQLGLGMAKLAGMNPPAMVFPPLNQLAEHLTPAATFGWTDEAGYHLKSFTPFPGSQTLVANSSLVTGTSTAVSILLPALNAARERANRVRCASNLRQMGIGAMLYANDHKGQFPPDLGTMITASDLPPRSLHMPQQWQSPASGDPLRQAGSHNQMGQRACQLHLFGRQAEHPSGAGNDFGLRQIREPRPARHQRPVWRWPCGVGAHVASQAIDSETARPPGWTTPT
ncbi:MAG TPA: hypothetical protein VHP11_12385 [Tepidisphaeraceae bacterium]|nr:hypothetical protein [Tepidisphaeraceae bacterium]